MPKDKKAKPKRDDAEMEALAAAKEADMVVK